MGAVKSMKTVMMATLVPLIPALMEHAKSMKVLERPALKIIKAVKALGVTCTLEAA